jgi:hypothetical protein
MVPDGQTSEVIDLTDDTSDSEWFDETDETPTRFLVWDRTQPPPKELRLRRVMIDTHQRDRYLALTLYRMEALDLAAPVDPDLGLWLAPPAAGWAPHLSWARLVALTLRAVPRSRETTARWSPHIGALLDWRDTLEGLARETRAEERQTEPLHGNGGE